MLPNQPRHREDSLKAQREEETRLRQIREREDRWLSMVWGKVKDRRHADAYTPPEKWDEEVSFPDFD